MISAIEGAHRGDIYEVRIQPRETGNRLLTVGRDGFLRIWNTSLERIAEVDASEPVIDARWMSETSIVAITSRGAVAIEFNFGQSEESRELPNRREYLMSTESMRQTSEDLSRKSG